MLGIDRTLFGELWLDVTDTTRITVELEAPGFRTPLRTSHVIRPPRRWTLHWITVVDPDHLIRQLDRLSPWERAAATSLMNRTAVMGNPYGAGQRAADGIDHLDYLRSGSHAMALERRFGIPASPIAIAKSRDLRMNAAPTALLGNGIRYGLLLDDDHHAFYRYTGRDGSRVITASPPPGGTPEHLAFAAGRDGMASAIETWLTTSPGLRPSLYSPDAALVVSTRVEDNRLLMLDTINAWHQRFAYPRIVVGGADEFFERIESTTTSRELFSVANPMPFRAEPNLETLTEASNNRGRAVRTRVGDLVTPLNTLLGMASSNILDFASAVDFAFDGSMVFNPSPLPRTDVVRMPDETERVVTRVPGLGYVFIPNAIPAPPAPYLNPGDAAVSGQRFTIRLNEETGAIQSMHQRDEARAWADAERGGLNDIPTARLSSLQRFRMPNVGSRLYTERRTTWGRLRSIYTVYDDTPWVDIENTIDNLGKTPVRYSFAFNLDVNSVAWETAAGYEVQAPPATNFAHLRWMSVRSNDEWAALVRCIEHPFARVSSDTPPGAITKRTSLVSVTPGGRSRYRINTMSPTDPSDSPWRFGWHGEPFIVTPVTRGGRVQVPRFGQLLTIDPGVMVVAVKEADDDFGIIVYLQEVMGRQRNVRLRPDLIQFASANLVDFAERDRGETLEVSEDGIRVPMNRFGITAVRLSQLSLQSSV